MLQKIEDLYAYITSLQETITDLKKLSDKKDTTIEILCKAVALK